jgi:hypothetical protein
MRRGGRRFVPGPGTVISSPGFAGTASTTSRHAAVADQQLDDEIEAIARTLRDRGTLGRTDLGRAVGARGWGPGRLRRALREAVREGRATRVSHGLYGPGDAVSVRGAPPS